MELLCWFSRRMGSSILSLHVRTLQLKFGFQVVVSPASYASFAGIIGCAFYALASGIPVMIIAFFGQSISERYPSCQSVGDFIHLRFGPTARLLVSSLTLFNMCIAMLAEYTTIGSLFQVPTCP